MGLDQPLTTVMGDPGIVMATPSLEEAQIIELKAEREASEARIRKLEQLIDEKNRMISEFDKGVISGQEQDVEIEGLKKILWSQIDELKQNNKKLKAEIERLLQENMDLQTKVYAVSGLASTSVVVKPVDGQAGEEVFAGKTDGLQGALVLHDVFDEGVK